MSQRHSVSIGMPVFNGEKFVREALDSLMGQTFTDFELIISDNASTDATEPICRSYACHDSRIRYIRQPVNLGALPNFQFVLNKASGEYFMWAACDDKWDRNWIRLLHNRLEESKGSAVFGRLLQIDEISQSIDHPATHNSFQFNGGYLKRRVFFYLEFEGFGKSNLFYSLFRRARLKEMILSDYSADYYALFNLLGKFEFTSIKNVFLYKRIHDSGQGITRPKPISKKLCEILTFDVFWRDLCISKGYLNHTRGCEWLLIAMFIPVKTLLTHIIYARRVVGKSIRYSAQILLLYIKLAGSRNKASRRSA